MMLGLLQTVAPLITGGAVGAVLMRRHQQARIDMLRTQLGTALIGQRTALARENVALERWGKTITTWRNLITVGDESFVDRYEALLTDTTAVARVASGDADR